MKKTIIGILGIAGVLIGIFSVHWASQRGGFNGFIILAIVGFAAFAGAIAYVGQDRSGGSAK
jgi:hypothetical protein